MGKSISFLLGAGFSVPMGFPIGNKLGKEIIKKAKKEKSKEPNMTAAFVLNEMIKYFYLRIRKKFDYEKFYDRIYYFIYNKKFNEYLWTKHHIHQEHELKSFMNFYQRSIAEIFRKIPINNSLSIYEKFLNSLKELLDKGYEINIHSLNHDLVFESFKESSLIGNYICDGYDYESSLFEARGLKYPYYSGVYKQNIRLFKIHGSIDQYVYYPEDGSAIFQRIKINNSQNHDDIDKGEIKYLPASIAPDFLTGRDFKKYAYKKPYYKNLLSHFRKNLKKSKCLIIIGYSGNDRLINKIIVNNLHSPCFIYDKKKNCNLEALLEKIDSVKNFHKSKIEKFKLPTTINF